MNPMDLLKNMQQLQSKMSEAQARMREIVVTGSAGGGMVKVEMNGEFGVQSVTIDPEAVDPDDVGMLQDLVLAAVTDAVTRAKDQVKDEMSSVAGGLNLPPELLGGQ